MRFVAAHGQVIDTVTGQVVGNYRDNGHTASGNTAKEAIFFVIDAAICDEVRKLPDQRVWSTES